MAESGAKYVLREFNMNDYDEYTSWWTDGSAPKPSSLPKIGVVSGDMKAVGFLANTDTDISIIAFWYTNPQNTILESYRALKEVVKGLMQAAVIIGKTKVFCYTNNRGMIRLLESLNFLNRDGHLIVEVF